MDSNVLTAIISAATALCVSMITAGLTNMFTIRREREADWRKVKLELYKEYVTALSGIVEGHATAEAHLRYVNAVHTVMLVAPASVMQSLYAFLDYTRNRNTYESLDQHDKLLSALIHAIRRDAGNAGRRDVDLSTFRLITVPPHMRPTNPDTQ
jgi:hypothetical protein